MANAGVAFVAQQRDVPLAGKIGKLCASGHRLGQLQLPGIDALELGVPTRPRRRTTVGGGAKRLEMAIFDPSLGQRSGQRGLGEAGSPR